MRLVTVQGTMGSGKTTLLKRLMEDASARGLSSALILNEQGRTDYEPQFAARHLAGIERLSGG